MTTVALPLDYKLEVQTADDPHNHVVAIHYHGVRISVTLRDAEYAAATDTNPDTVLVFVDRDDDQDTTVIVGDDTVFSSEI